MGLKHISDKIQRLQTHCGRVLFLLGKSLYKDILFLCPQWGSGPYLSRNFLIWTHFVNASWKKWDLLMGCWTYACTFPVQRKEINVVKVRFTMRYSSRKLSHEKAEPQFATFEDKLLVLSRLRVETFIISQKNNWNPAIFWNPARGSGKKVHACSLRFSALNSGTWMASAEEPFLPLSFLIKQF